MATEQRPIRLPFDNDTEDRLFNDVVPYEQRGDFAKAAHCVQWGLHLKGYRAYGEQVVCPDPGLVEALMRTDHPESVQPPFDCFYVAFQEPVRVAGSEVLGFHASRGDEFWDSVDNIRELLHPETQRALDRDLLDDGWQFLILSRNGTLRGDSTKRWAPLFVNLCAYIEAIGPSSTDTSRPARKQALQAKADRAGPKKRKKLQRQADKASGATVVYLGTGYQAQTSGDGTSGGDNRREHWVRGHWRNQPYGFGRRLRRKRWIQPHKRCTGSPQGPVPGRTYRLE